MAKYTSGRQRNLKVGISSYSENTQVVSIIGRVGIGSTVFNADYDLDVRGTTKLSGNIILGNSSSNLINVPGRISSNFYPDGDGTYDVGRGPQIGSGANRWKDANFYGKGTFDGGVDAHDLELGVGSANLIYSTSGNLELNSQSGITNIDDILTISGNTGIGTANPTSKLWVDGDGYFTGILTAKRLYSSLYGEFTGGSISGTSIVGTALSISGISTFTNGPVLIGGSVGIGTTNPQAKFHSYGIDDTLSTVLGAPTNTLIEVNNGDPWSIGFRRTDLGPTADVAAWIDNNRNFIIANGLPNGGFNYSVGLHTEYVKLYAYDQERFSTLGVGATVIGTLFANQLSVSGITTVGFLTASNVYVSGVTTSNAYYIGTSQVISSAKQLQNIASLDATTTATIETAIQQAPNDFTSLNITGISTLQSTTLIGGGTSTGTANQVLQVNSGAYVSGSIGIGTTNPTSKLTVQGNVKVSGVVTATSFYGSGDNLTGLIPNVVSTSSTTTAQYIGFLTTSSGVTTSILADTTLTYIPSSGNLGIGTTIPTSKIHIIGNTYISGILTATDINSASDIRLKTNIKPFENTLEKIIHINGVSFNWIENNAKSGGIIAQDVEKVFPELVNGGDHKTVNYNGLIGVLVESIKELKQEIEDLKLRLNQT
jgi:hypothetical protein